MGRCLQRQGNVRGPKQARVSCIIKLPKMMAIYLMRISFRAILNKKQERSSTIDNITLIAYINRKGGPCQTFSQLATAIWTAALDNGVFIRYAHIAVKLLQPTTVREHQTSTTECFTLNSFHNKIGCGDHIQYTDLRTVSTHNSRVLAVIHVTLLHTTLGWYRCAQDN